MNIVMYGRVGRYGHSPSPFSRRLRYSLAHKGVSAEFCFVHFAEVATIQGLSGHRMVLTLRDGDPVIRDFSNIAWYLEDRFSDRPSLLGGHPVSLA
jgi:glutathione S-transferase